ncbi:MAG TPA: hypothetical protein PKW71_12275, partial [Anaerohalosphaeraceae bacterium]|nr:hypothetical protein [Anaerohalosphaeraceae bacterium]
GKEPDVIQKIIDGQIIGTLFAARQEKLSNRARWILHNRPEGTIYIDEGAMAAIRKHKSLLPSGVKGVEGTFPTGAVVMINDAAKAITSLSSDELNRVAGLHSTKIRDLLGPNRRDVVALPEDIVFVETG